MKDILVIACSHGNEQYGLKVEAALSEKYDFLIGNPKAIQKNVRFIDTDLNRSYPGDADSESLEERRAVENLEVAKKYDYVIDLHSTTEKHPLVGIITKANEHKIEFARKMGIRHLVLLNEMLASGRTINDHHDCVLTLELGPHGLALADEVIELLDHPKPAGDMKIYEIFEKITMGEGMKSKLINLHPVNKGYVMAASDSEEMLAEYDFIPILANEGSYKNVLCFAAKLIE